ncbi:MAG: hypothetical protein AAFQ44_11105 [Pseudomonadota bacterium]
MTTFLVSYDLAETRPEALAQRSAQLAHVLMMLGSAWAQPLANTWYVRTELDADSLETMINQWLEDDDQLLVQDVTSQALLTNARLRWFRRRDDGKTSPADDAGHPRPQSAMAYAGGQTTRLGGISEPVTLVQALANAV